MMVLLQLFIAFLQIGLFSFGGGYAALSLIQNQAVDVHHWLTLQEFSDLTAISQMTPGPIAINAATFTGLRAGGFIGAVVATLGCILPSCILVSAIVWFYIRHRDSRTAENILACLRPATAALIGAAGLSIGLQAFFPLEQGTATFQPQLVVFALLSFYLLKKKKMDPVLVMCMAGGLNLVFCWIFL